LSILIKRHNAGGAWPSALRTGNVFLSSLARRPNLLLVALHLLQFGFLLWLAYSMRDCCDADYYPRTGRALLSEGLLYPDKFAGYRSYFVPLLFGGLQSIPLALGSAIDPARFLHYALCLIYSLVSLATCRHILRTYGWRSCWLNAFPVFFNPLVLYLVPLPLQESVIAILVLPLLVLLLTSSSGLPRRIALAVLLCSVAYLIRESMLWLCIPCAIAVFAGYWRAGAVRERRSWTPCVLACIAALVLFAPQIYIARAKFHAFTPYPSAGVVEKQILWGVEMFKYESVLTTTGAYGKKYFTPFATIPKDRTTLAFYSSTWPAGPLLAMTHAWVGLHPWSFRTYLEENEVGPFGLPLILSAAAVFLALLYFTDFVARSHERPAMAFLFALVLMSCAYTAFAAVETRFGLFGFIAVGSSATRLLSDRRGRSIVVRNLLPMTAYIALCLIIASLISSAH
jgi:hypothetical protein